MNIIQSARTRASAFLGALGRKGSALLTFLLRHKIAATALILVVILGLIALLVLRPRRSGALEAAGEGYVRTVTLERGTLEDSISATGTVESSQVSTVTTDLKYTVKEVHVQVGDSVKEGDIICTLDTSELEDSIQKMKEDLAENKADAQEQYEDAQTALTEAQEKVTETYDDMEEAEDDLDDAKSAYDKAYSIVKPYQSKVDSANSALLTALNTMNSAQSTLSQAQAAYDQLVASVGEDGPGVAEAKTALEQAKTNFETAEKAYQDAQTTLNDAQSQLQTAQSTSNYNSLSSAYTQAQTAYDQAKSTYENALTAAENAEDTRDKALDNYNKAGESDELEELEDQLDKCTLKAQTDGKVTSLNATVGSVVDGAVATIQDTSKLQISINIAEYDIENVKEGMKAIITSDVIDGEISGTLTQISPTASGGGNSSSTFSAKVTVDSADSGLLIGTNASVEIIQSTTENVFTVPLDAIETLEDGTTQIYVRSETQEDTFEPVPVTVGETNDYYAEISGDSLKEGMVVKASVLDETITQELPFGESGRGEMSMEMGDMSGSVVVGAAPAGGGGGGMGGGPMGG